MPMDWFDGSVQLTFEAGLSAGGGGVSFWDAALWDSATWGPDVTFSDLSTRLKMPLTVTRRFGREVSTWESGTASVLLDNTDDALTPDNLSGPYAVAGVSQVRPGLPARLRATYRGVTYPLYRGYADDIVGDWAPGSTYATASLPCVDEMSNLAAFDGVEQSPVGAGELSGARVHRILNNAGHTGDRIIDPGRTTVQATTLASNAASELKLVNDSEGGAFYIDESGATVFADRFGLLEDTRSITVQATFGDGSGLEIPCTAMQTAYGRDQVVGVAALARVGGTEQVAVDETSRALYPGRRYSRDDLVCETDPQVLELSQWYVARFKDPEYRVTSVTIKPRTNPAVMFPLALGLKVRDLVVVVRRRPSLTITQYCFISGIQHTVTQDDWQTTFELTSATTYRQFAMSLWDTGTWDGVRWAF